MDDLELFKQTLNARLDELCKIIINSNSGCEMGIAPIWVKEQFAYTKKQIGLKK